MQFTRVKTFILNTIRPNANNKAIANKCANLTHLQVNLNTYCMTAIPTNPHRITARNIHPHPNASPIGIPRQLDGQYNWHIQEFLRRRDPFGIRYLADGTEPAYALNKFGEMMPVHPGEGVWYTPRSLPDLNEEERKEERKFWEELGAEVLLW